MKTTLAAIILTLGTLIPSIAEEVKQSVIVSAPETWKVKFQGNNVIQTYSVKHKEGDSLQFTRLPGDIRARQSLEDVENRATNFVAAAEDQNGFKLKNKDFTVEEIHGDSFSGRFVKFEIEGGTCRIMFIIGDSEGICLGEFSGKEERWPEALSILQKLKKG